MTPSHSYLLRRGALAPLHTPDPGRCFSSVATGVVLDVPLTKGFVAVVDAADHEWLSQWRWNAHVCRNGVYAFRRVIRQRVAKRYWMHRELACPPDHLLVDHINGDGLDNRRANLRVCSSSQNAMNRKAARGVESGFKGVSRDGAKWRARIRIDGTLLYLGCFTTADAAARAYDQRALAAFGEFARLNFPEAA